MHATKKSQIKVWKTRPTLIERDRVNAVMIYRLLIKGIDEVESGKEFVFASLRGRDKAFSVPRARGKIVDEY